MRTRAVFVVVLVAVSAGSTYGLNLHPPYFTGFHVTTDPRTGGLAYESNGVPGIQDDELLPDPNANGVIDLDEWPETFRAIVDATTTLRRLRHLLLSYQAVFSRSPSADILEREREIVESRLRQRQALLAQYQIGSGDRSPAVELARLGCQVDLSEGRVYLHDGTELSGAAADVRVLYHHVPVTHTEFGPHGAQEITIGSKPQVLTLGVPSRIDTPFGFFVLEPGDDVVVDIDSATIESVSSDRDTFPFYSNDGRVVGTVASEVRAGVCEVTYTHPVRLDLPDCIVHEPESVAILLDVAPVVREVSGGRLVRGDMTVKDVAFAGFFHDGTLSFVRSDSPFACHVLGETHALTQLSVYPGGAVRRLHIAESDTGARGWFHTDMMGQETSWHTPTLQFYRSGALQSIRGGAYIDLTIAGQALERARVSELWFRPDGSLRGGMTRASISIELPGLGEVSIEKFLQESHNGEWLFELDDDGGPYSMFLPGLGVSNVEEGVICVCPDGSVRFDSAEVTAPATTTLPDGSEYAISRGSMELRWWPDGALRSISPSLWNPYLEVQLDGTNVWVLRNALWFETGVPWCGPSPTSGSQIYRVDGFGDVLAGAVYQHPDGGPCQISLSDDQNLVWNSGGNELGIDAVLYFYPTGAFRGASPVGGAELAVPGGWTIPADHSEFQLYPDANLWRLVGELEQIDLTTPDRVHIRSTTPVAMHLEWYQGGALRVVAGLPEDVSITLPGGVPAVATWMLRYDERGRLIDWY